MISLKYFLNYLLGCMYVCVTCTCKCASREWGRKSHAMHEF